MDDEQRAWILGSQNGDPEAFAALIRTHQHMVHALTFRMTGSMSDAEDLAQETFIQAHRSIECFRGDSAFSSWLYRIAVNLCLNWRQREARRQKVHESWTNESESAAGDGSLSEQVQQALLKLNPKQRAAIILTVYEEKNHAEAGKILGCSETTVSWRVFAAKKKLKRWLSTGETSDD